MFSLERSKIQFRIGGIIYYSLRSRYVTEIYVIEVNTDGDKGYPDNIVVEVGVCRVNLDTMDFDSIYNDIILLDPLDMGKTSLDWITDTAGIDVRELYLGSPQEEVVSRVKEILKGNEVACFDIGETFGRFLLYDPWDFTKLMTIRSSVSARMPGNASPTLKTNLQERIGYAYSKLCPDDPAEVGNGRRALQLAQMTSEIIIRLRKSGMY